ncbi:type II secretion system protein GspD [Noviherbaspirillum sp.]|uniref:type II secretion system protein GspD n=1 Tax=Noviherbaspirillum sp. TaxID=1926288 RepID=UPI002FE36034
MIKAATSLCGCLLLTACGTQPAVPSAGHLMQAPQAAGSIPQPVQQSPSLKPPKPAPKAETYSVTVHKVPVQSLLFALARDAKLNIDIHPDIEGHVTLNALDQTLPQLLNRISRQVDMRYELDGPNLAVLPDAPFLRNYRIDYVNISRDSSSNVSIATQISSTGTDNGIGAGGGGGGGGNNNSTTSVTNKSNNRFWETLVQNIKDTLRETDKILPDGDATAEQDAAANTAGNGAAPARGAAPKAGATTAPRRNTYREAASVIANPETGLIAVRATSRQHEKIQEFLDLVMSSAKRQVMIEATVIEVQLSDQYQQGINWSRVGTYNGGPASMTETIGGSVNLPSGVITGTTPGLLTLRYANPTSGLGNIAATIQLLESFGKVKVLSSPKISVLNNQTALLKVVDNRVYFTFSSVTTSGQVGIAPLTTYTSEVHTVPVGFVMSVTPQIADSDEVTLNVRPTISRIIGYVQDPNPALSSASTPVVSNVPVIQTREMESVLKVSSGQIAVMGGLMQDSINNAKDAIPGVNNVPLLSDVLAYRNENSSKTELVIFMRPVVVKDASLNGDYREFRDYLPNRDRPLNNPPYGTPAPVPSIAPPAANGAG